MIDWSRKMLIKLIRLKLKHKLDLSALRSPKSFLCLSLRSVRDTLTVYLFLFTSIATVFLIFDCIKQSCSLFCDWWQPLWTNKRICDFIAEQKSVHLPQGENGDRKNMKIHGNAGWWISHPFPQTNKMQILVVEHRFPLNFLFLLPWK